MNAPGIYSLFVYGSLRSGFQSQAYEYMSRYFNLVGNGRVKGRLYDLGDYPAALPTTDDQFIYGELYQVKKQDEFSYVIGQLDDYEGVLVEAGEVPLYRREMAEIETAQGLVTAWVYWYNGDVSGRPFIPSGDLLQYLSQRNG
ncbi:MAG: gamma-glutamylcyclotransferase [Chitinophagaceae bacterium]|nr:gamma-glutamylcyclotransferase [Chitinophagaceae bacterium]